MDSESNPSSAGSSKSCQISDVYEERGSPPIISPSPTTTQVTRAKALVDDAVSADLECMHKKSTGGIGHSTSVLLPQFVKDSRHCPECRLIRQAVEAFKPGFIQEHAFDSLVDIEVAFRERSPYSFEGLVEVRLHRQRFFRNLRKWERPTYDLLFRFRLLRRSPVEPLYEDVDSREARTGRLGQALDIVTDSSSPGALDRASKWLAHCVENDKACEPPDDDFMPTYLINVGSDSRKPFLFKPSGPRKPYASLSYCWGPDVEDVLKTTLTNLKHQYESIPLESMAPAIQDALKICRGLGIQYLWVDSLCLIQDDRQAWLHDASKMDQIFLNSHLTIAALEPGTCKSHFLGPQKFGNPNWQRLVHTDIPMREDGPELELFVRPEGGDRAKVSKRNTLDTRAWCMQESLLPNRRLCFDGNEMIWECLSRKLCECGHTIRRPLTVRYAEQGAGIKLRRLKEKPILSRPRPFLHNFEKHLFDNGLETENSEGIGLNMEGISLKQNGYPGKMNNVWRRLVSDYSHRGITKEEDRLRAVSGLAKIFVDRLRKDSDWPGEIEYLAGLWKNEFHFDLAWVATGSPLESATETYSKASKDVEWNVPTWSWASVREPVTFPWERAPRQWKYSPVLTHKCTVGGVECKREYQEDETSAVIQGAATLYGRLVPVKLIGGGSAAPTIVPSIPVSKRRSFTHPGEFPVWLDSPLREIVEQHSFQSDVQGDFQGEAGSVYGYYCFRLFAWVASTGMVDDEGERVMGPETWFLVLRKSQRVPGALERIGIGWHESTEGKRCPIFENAERTFIRIV